MIRARLLGIQARDTTGGQGVRAGSLYLAVAIATSGVLTVLFQSASTRLLGPERYGLVGTLWSAVFLFAQVLWVGASQTLGRYVADREARGVSWLPVERSVRHLEMLLLGAFLTVVLALSPLLTRRFFGGEWLVMLAFPAAVGGYALNYHTRGLLSGRRRFSRLGRLVLVESVARLAVTVALLLAGVGVLGPAVGIAIAPFLSALLVRSARAESPTVRSEPFNLGGALGFAAPVLAAMIGAQVLANGGPLFITGIGGPDAHEQAGLLLAALILTRTPQFVLSPVISNLLPHLSRLAALQDHRQFDNFVVRALALVTLAGVGLVAGVWLFGEWAVRLLYGPEFGIGRGLLVALGALAAFYLLSELWNQVLFARGLAHVAAVGWFLGVGVALAFMLLVRTELLERVSDALAAGGAATAISLSTSYLLTRNRRTMRVSPPVG